MTRVHLVSYNNNYVVALTSTGETEAM